jgi:ribosomal protein L37AE/L43A
MKLTSGPRKLIFNMMKAAVKTKEATPVLACPVCMSDRLEPISSRMAKCESCGFIWNHEVSERDNLLLILEHQAKREKVGDATPPLTIVREKKKKRTN